MKKIYRILLIFAFSIVFLGAHILVYKTIQNAFSISDIDTLYMMKMIMAILTFSFFVSIAIAKRVNTLVTRIIYVALAVWIGLLFHLLMTSVYYWGISLIFQEQSQHLGIILFYLSVAVTLYGLIQAWTLRVTPYTLNLKNLPDFWKGKRIAFISDLHLGQVHKAKLSRKVVSRLNRLKPELLLIGGDLYDGVAVDENAVIAPFKDIRAPLGTYFVTGNHEEYGDEKAYEQAIRNIGIRILNNELVTLEGLQIIGVNYHDTNSSESLRDVINTISFDLDRPSVLVKHVPSHLNVTEEAGIDIQLSGHTHDGQMFPLGLIGSMLDNGYVYGLRMFEKMQILISSGVGSWGPPVRVGTRSEIVLITLENEDNK